MKGKSGSMRRVVFLAVIFLAVQTSLSYSQQSPQAYMDQAVSNIKVAKTLVEKANSVLAGNPGTEDLKTAIYLYAEAGRSFEESARIFKALGPDYVSQSDIDGCVKAVQDCLAAIERCKGGLQRLNQSR